MRRAGLQGSAFPDVVLSRLQWCRAALADECAMEPCLTAGLQVLDAFSDRRATSKCLAADVSAAHPAAWSSGHVGCGEGPAMSFPAGVRAELGCL